MNLAHVVLARNTSSVAVKISNQNQIAPRTALSWKSSPQEIEDRMSADFLTGTGCPANAVGRISNIELNRAGGVHRNQRNIDVPTVLWEESVIQNRIAPWTALSWKSSPQEIEDRMSADFLTGTGCPANAVGRISNTEPNCAMDGAFMEVQSARNRGQHVRRFLDRDRMSRQCFGKNP